MVARGSPDGNTRDTSTAVRETCLLEDEMLARISGPFY